MINYLALSLALLSSVVTFAGNKPVATETPDECEKGIAKSYSLIAPFTGQQLLQGMQKKDVGRDGHLVQVTLETRDHKQRVNLDWSDSLGAFKVTRVAGNRQFPLAVGSVKEISSQNKDMEIIYRYLTFKTPDSEVVSVYDNSEKISRLVAKKFSCEFLDFFSCICLN